MNKDVRDKLEKRAKDLGFDSAQAYIRVWAKAEADGRRIDYGYDDWGQPSDEAAARLNKQAKEAIQDLKAGKLKTFGTAQEFMKDLRE